MQKLILSQSLQQKLSPQQIQFIKLLQVPTAELDTRIEEELEKAMKRTRKEGEQHFLNSCQNVIQKKSMGFFESVVQLCTDMAMANKELHPAEARLLEISRSLLIQ